MWGPYYLEHPPENCLKYTTDYMDGKILQEWAIMNYNEANEAILHGNQLKKNSNNIIMPVC